MLQIQNVNYTIGERELLRDIYLVINPGLRIGLIGANGAGKTTLLRIISGQLQPTSGDITHPRDYSIGYLPQEEVAIEGGTVLGSALQGHRNIFDIESEMEQLHEKLAAHPPDQKTLLERLGKLESHYEMIGGYEMEFKAKKILSGLGFSSEDFIRSISQLSGGWRMRVYLARLLLRQPDLLLLDEPTNHLDIESLEWVEQYLKGFAGSMILVSHDRFFIDRLAQEIAELFNGRLTRYAGNYHFFEKQKAIEREQLFKQWEAQQAERQRIQRFIDRFRYKASKAAQVQSRVKQLEKMETIELPEEQQSIHFKIQADVKSYKEVLKIENLHFRYQSAWVLKGLNMNLYRGEKVALVGINGAGKTTLTRLITGELKPQIGKLELGERVHVGYYTQHQIDALNLDNTVYDEVEASAARSFHPMLRDILGVFRFSGDAVQKRVGVLSGGEKARVSLAKMLLSPANFLIMDEPTNHLDLQSKEALEQALVDYDGTLLLISHDRYFLDKLVSRVIELKDGKLKEYTGNYSAYLAGRQAEAGTSDEDNNKAADAGAKSKTTGRNIKTKEQKQKEAQLRQAVSRERNQLKDKIEVCEREIESLTKSKAQLEQQLADPQTYKDSEKATGTKAEFEGIVDKLARLETEWTEAQLRYETILEQLQNSD